MNEKINPDLEALCVPLDDLHEDPANARIHSDRNIEAIKASFREFGQQKPLVAAPGENGRLKVIAGNGTLRALREMEWERVAVVRFDSESAARQAAFAIADNRTAELAEWDDLVLPQVLESIGPEINDLTITGFDNIELQEIIDYEPPEPPEDIVPEPPADPVSRTGDLWLMNDHRLLCGDCRNKKEVDNLIKQIPRVILTSPPYYNARDYAQWDSIDHYINDMYKVIKLISDLTTDLLIIWNIGEQPVLHLDLSSLTSCKFNEIEDLKFQEKIAWIKSGATFDIPRNAHIKNGLYYPAFSWEPILIFKKGKHPRIENQFISELIQECTDTWKIETVASQNESKGYHCAAFPVALPIKALKCYSPSDSIVYDPFLGSGTTLIAADQLDRICYGIEIEPRYVDAAVRRWQDHTGQEARLEATGQTWSDVEIERCVQGAPGGPE
jgi:DNA modification methylase